MDGDGGRGCVQKIDSHWVFGAAAGAGREYSCAFILQNSWPRAATLFPSGLTYENCARLLWGA